VRRGTGLLGDVDVDSSVGPVTCREEGQALQVVPVEVAEQDRATERLTSQQVGDLANPGAGVDDQPGRPVGVTDGDRCRVAAIAAELETRGGGRTPNPAYAPAWPRLRLRQVTCAPPAGGCWPARPRPPGRLGRPGPRRSGRAWRRGVLPCAVRLRRSLALR